MSRTSIEGRCDTAREKDGANNMTQPRYQQIADRLREEIAAIPLGTRLSPENELAAQLGVSRPTVRQAMELLVREGRLVRVKGSGTFVSRPKLMHESTSFISGYREECRKKSRILRTKVLCLRVEQAKGQVAEELRVAEGSQVVRLTRVRHLENMYDNAPVVYTTVYVPQKLFPDMAEQDFTDASFYETLDTRGLTVVHASRRLEVMMPPEEVAGDLGITSFEPVVYITSRGLTGSGLAVEYSESYYPASRSSFQIEIQR